MYVKWQLPYAQSLEKDIGVKSLNKKVKIVKSRKIDRELCFYTKNIPFP